MLTVPRCWMPPRSHLKQSLTMIWTLALGLMWHFPKRWYAVLNVLRCADYCLKVLKALPDCVNPVNPVKRTNGRDNGRRTQINVLTATIIPLVQHADM